MSFARPRTGSDDDGSGGECRVLFTPGTGGDGGGGGPARNSSSNSSRHGAPTTMPLEAALAVADASGRHHRRVAHAVLAATLSGGCAGATSPFILGPLSDQLAMSAAASGALAAAVFVGMWIGSFAGGVLSDGFGPGRAMLLGVLGQLAGAVVAALLPPPASIALLVASRVVVGLGIVVCYQGGNTYLAEWLPAAARAKYMSLLHFTISAGGLATTVLATVVPPHSWRLLLLLNAAPAAAVLAACARLVYGHESPRWQLLNGRGRECLEMLRQVQAEAGGGRAGGGGSACGVEGESRRWLPDQLCLAVAGDSAAQAGVPAARAKAAAATTMSSTGSMSVRTRWRQMTHGSLWRLLVVGTLVAFSLNFGSKGLETWSGVYVERLGLPHLSRGIYFATLTGKMVGDFLNIRASEAAGRIRMLQLGFWGAGLGLLAFVYAESTAALLVLAFVCGVATDVLWCCIYMYLTEAFPTSVRSTAFGLAMGLGRSGGVVSAGIGDAFGSIRTPFLLYAGSFVAGALLVSLFSVETARRPLADTVRGHGAGGDGDGDDEEEADHDVA